MAMCARTRSNRIHDERGAAAVEFVVMMPIVMVILFGTIAAGLALNRMQTYLSAAREGARYAAVRCAPDSTTGCTSDLIVNRVQSAAIGYPLGPGSPAADIACSASTVGNPVTVSWQQDIPIVVPLLPDLSKQATIRGVFRCE
jgi:Flp pilus assembly protein TadG